MNGNNSAFLEADILGQANRLRSTATEHDTARANVAKDPAVLAAEANRHSVFSDVRAALRTTNRAFTRGWALMQLRSRVHSEDTKAAAIDVVEGRRPALASLPPLSFATAPETGAIPRRRARSA